MATLSDVATPVEVVVDGVGDGAVTVLEALALEPEPELLDALAAAGVLLFDDEVALEAAGVVEFVVLPTLDVVLASEPAEVEVVVEQAPVIFGTHSFSGMSTPETVNVHVLKVMVLAVAIISGHLAHTAAVCSAVGLARGGITA